MAGAPVPRPRPQGELAGGDPEAGLTTAVLAPQLHLAANSSAVLVTGVPGAARVFDVPSLALRAEHPTHDLDRVALSAGGRALIVLTGGDELLVHRDGGWLAHRAPYGRVSIAGLAVADDGSDVLLLVGGEAGRIERWTLPPGQEPSAAVTLGTVERGSVAGDGELGVVAAFGAEAEPLGAWELAEGRCLLARPGPVRLLPFAGRVWGVWPDRIAGLGDGVELPGTAGDRLTFSPSSGHVLAWRGDGVGVILLRVFDAATGAERFTVRVPIRGLPVLALGDDLAVHSLRVDDDGRLDATRVA